MTTDRLIAIGALALAGLALLLAADLWLDQEWNRARTAMASEREPSVYQGKSWMAG